MKEKKELILKKCRDLIYKKVFNNDYDTVKRLYTDSNIQTKLDDYLSNLISKGELFYGDDFTWNFVNKPTDDAREMLISNLNNYEEETFYEENQPKEKNYAYESLRKELMNHCYLSLEQVNSFIKKYNTNEKIRKEAIDYFEKKEKKLQELDEMEPIPVKSEELDETEPIPVKPEELDETEPIPVKSEELDEMEPIPVKSEELDEIPIPVKTEEPKPGLIQKFKEKWKQPQFRKKVIIGAAITAIGLVAVALNPEVQSFFSQLISNFGPDQIDTEMLNSISDQAGSINTAVDVAQIVDPSVLDTSSWDLAGLNIADNAYDAVNENTNLTANEWFSSKLQGLYDTSTHQMLNVSDANLHDTNYVKELLQNGNVAAVFGNGEIGTLEDVSGFANGTDVLNLIDNNGNVQELINNVRSR